MGFFFTERHWKVDDITAIDIAKSTNPLVEGIHWRYWNLENLGHRLHEIHELHQNEEEKLPKEVLALRGKFDIVVALFGGDSGGGFEYDKEVCEFLAKDGAFIAVGYEMYIKGQDAPGTRRGSR